MDRKSSTWPAPSAKLSEILEDRLAGSPASKRKMFGMPAYFIKGNMFAGIFAEQLFLRLSSSDQNELRSQGGKAFEPIDGRPMSDYMVLPENLIDDKGSLDSWIDRSVKHALTLPEKKKKK